MSIPLWCSRLVNDALFRRTGWQTPRLKLTGILSQSHSAALAKRPILGAWCPTHLWTCHPFRLQDFRHRFHQHICITKIIRAFDNEEHLPCFSQVLNTTCPIAQTQTGNQAIVKASTGRLQARIFNLLQSWLNGQWSSFYRYTSAIDEASIAITTNFY
jgi:hypothetical protein